MKSRKPVVPRKMLEAGDHSAKIGIALGDRIAGGASVRVADNHLSKPFAEDNTPNCFSIE